MFTRILAAMTVAASFVGCAAIDQSREDQKEKLLAAAGFQARPVTTERQQQLVAALKPYKIQTRSHKGTLVYLYPDPRDKEVYVGGPKAYGKYRDLVAQQQIVTQDELIQGEHDMAEEQWNYFGPWLFGGVPAPAPMTSW